MFQGFEKTGSFDVLSHRSRKRTDSRLVEEVAAAVQEEKSDGVKRFSARGIAQTLSRPVSGVYKISTKHPALLSKRRWMSKFGMKILGFGSDSSNEKWL